MAELRACIYCADERLWTELTEAEQEEIRQQIAQAAYNAYRANGNATQTTEEL